MVAEVVNYPDWNRGDTIRARIFTIEPEVDEVRTPLDLSTLTIRVNFVKGSRVIVKTVGNGLTIVDAAAGKFQIDKFKLDYPGTWRYDVEITLANGDVRTWIKGHLKIFDDTTK